MMSLRMGLGKRTNRIIFCVVLLTGIIALLLWTNYYCNIQYLNTLCFPKQSNNIHDDITIDTELRNKLDLISIINTYSKNFEKVVYNKSECPSALIFARSSPYSGMGNHLIEYASAWATAKQNNFIPVVSDLIFSRLNSLFHNLTVLPAAAFLSYLNADCAQRLRHFFYKGYGTKTSEELNKRLSERKPIALRPAVILVDEIVSMRLAFKKEFRIWPAYLKHAEEELQIVRQNVDYSRGKNSEITYVGVHVRRKDYHVYLRIRYGMKNNEFAGVKYFQHALAYMMKQLNAIGKWMVAFLVVSDDKKWTTKELIPQLQSYVELNGLHKNVSVFWSGNKDYRKDFALLASCNHTIITYGTFGASASLLAGGMTVVYDVTSGVQTKITAAMHFARDIAGWVIMN